MTEAEWLTSDNPTALLDHLRHAGAVTDRQLKAWVEACREKAALRSDYQWERNLDTDLQGATDDWGLGNPVLLENCPLPWRAAALRDICGNPWRPLRFLRSGQRACIGPEGKLYALHPNSPAVVMFEQFDPIPYTIAELDEPIRMPDLKMVRGTEVIGIDPAIVTPTVLAIATAIHDENRWEECPILADALEDAGATCDELLRHLRGGCPIPWCRDGGWFSGEESGDKGPFVGRTRHVCPHYKQYHGSHKRAFHVRGCWAIYLIRGDT